MKRYFSAIFILFLVILTAGCVDTTSTCSKNKVSVANFTGYGNQNLPQFEIKGENFILVMNAETDSSSTTGSINVDISSNNGFSFYQGRQCRTFKGQELSDYVKIESGPGNYSMYVKTENLKNWRIEVLDLQ